MAEVEKPPKSTKPSQEISTSSSPVRRSNRSAAAAQASNAIKIIQEDASGVAGEIGIGGGVYILDDDGNLTTANGVEAQANEEQTYVVQVLNGGDKETEQQQDDPMSAESEEGGVGEADFEGNGEKLKAVKKEAFKWATPADEFADDVGSEDEEEHGTYLVTGGKQDESDIVIRVEDGNKYFKEDKAGIVSPDKGKRGLKGKNRYECPKCDKVWSWPWELRRHVLTHYREQERQQATAFKCDECGKGFQWKRDLAQHKRLHTGEKLLVCSVCDKKFVTRQALLHHVVVHTGEKPFQCALCGNRFTQPANLRTHMKKKHGEAPVDNNKCPHCGDMFPSVIALHQHILEDHQSIVAETRENLELEKQRKEEEKVAREKEKEERKKERESRKKEKMDFNDYRKAGMKEWEINYEFHIGEGLTRGVDWDRTPTNTEIVCDICERKFGWRYEVMFHNLCHMTDEEGNAKNRVCPECDTTFKVPIGLKHHLLLHTGELPFLCLHCWRSFSSHIDLKLHIRKEHLFHLAESQAAAQQALLEKRRAAKMSAHFKNRPPQRLPPQRMMQQQQKRLEGTKVNLDSLNVIQHISNAAGGVELMVANQEDENGETQTILVNSDGTIVHTGNQDMIVVIQSDELDGQNAAAQAAANQGLIMLDPSQVQHLVGPDGQPLAVMQADGTIMQAADGARIIVSEDGTAAELHEAVAEGQHEETRYAIVETDETGEIVEAAPHSPKSKIIITDATAAASEDEAVLSTEAGEEQEHGEGKTVEMVTGEDPDDDDIAEK